MWLAWGALGWGIGLAILAAFFFLAWVVGR